MTGKIKYGSSGVLASMLLWAGLPGVAFAGFTAYNDCTRVSGSELEGNITTNRPASGVFGAISGALKNVASGTNVGAQASFSGIVTNMSAGNGFEPPVGSDAYNTLNGIVSPAGYVYWASNDITLNLTNLNSNSRYEIVLFGSRCSPSDGYENRSLLSTIEGVTAFTNASTPGATISQTTVANDTTAITAGNRDGYVVRYTGINPGDSAFAIRMRSSSTNTVYLNAFMLLEAGGPAISNGDPMVLSTTSAAVPGYLSSTGMIPTKVTLYWKADSDGGTNAGGWPNAADMGYRAVSTITTNLSGLSSNTTYYFRYYATNSMGGVWASPAGSFQTPAGVVTSAVSLGSADKRQQYASTRRTGIIISEIMYDPPYPNSNDLEFVEMFNAESVAMDVGNWRLSGDVDFLFPSNEIMPARTYWVIAKNPSVLQSVYSLSASIVKGPYTNTLSNGSGTIRLNDERGAVLLETKYSKKLPWPSAAAGAGHSLVLARPDMGEGTAAAWDSSSLRYGNPGTSNRVISANYGLKNVCINEFLVHTDPPQVDFVELYNKSSTGSVDLTGCFISDSARSLKRFEIPPTLIPAKGVVRFRNVTNELGFGFNMIGGAIYLMNPAGDVILDAVEYDAQENGVPTGRWPDGQPGFQELKAVTENLSNNSTTIKVRDVVINEIMFAPISGDDNDEYIELYNKGTSTVSVSSWRFIEGIDYTFPVSASIPAGGYIVVAKDLETFLSHYTNVSASMVLGGYGGTLSDSSERIVLAKPDDPSLPNQDFVAVDDVVYDDAWGKWTDAGGSSLELTDARSDNSRDMNWAGSIETNKAQWCTLQQTEVLDNEDFSTSHGLSTNFPYLEQAQVFLNGAGECMIDDVSVLRVRGTNTIEYMKNKALDSSTDWIIQGNHRDSAIENGAMHLRAQGGGEHRIGSLGANLNDGLVANDTVKMSLRARWLCGNPTLNFRLNGNGMWVFQVMDVPKNLGTPGKVNSRAANVGPALDRLTQSPILPPAGSNTTVSIRVQDPDGIGTVSLKWQVDGNGSSWTTTGMNDSGTTGDAVAGDGLWSAQISGQSAARVVAYYVDATDAGSRLTRYPSGVNMTTNEALMIFGQDSKTGCGDYGVMRMIMRPSLDQTNSASAFYSWDRMDNSAMPISIVYNDSRVVHGAGTRVSGSIWSRPKPGIDYWGQTTETFRKLEHTWRISMPKNDRICDSATFTMDGLNYASRSRYFCSPQDPVFIRERLQYWTTKKLGLPTSYQRYWHIFINDYHKGIVNGDAMLPDEGSMETHIPDQPIGDLFELKLWYDGNKTLGNNDNNAPGYANEQGLHSHALGPYQHADGRMRPEMFMFLWDKKANGPMDTSIEPLARVAQALCSTNGPSASQQRTYFKRVSQVLDPEQWGRSFAFRSATADGDTLCLGGRNKFMFVPKGGRTMALDYDLDWGFGQEGQTNRGLLADIDNTDTNNSYVINSDWGMRDHFWACNAMMRAYWRGMKAQVDEIWPSAAFAAEVTNLYNGHISNNLAYWKGRSDSGRQNVFSANIWGTQTDVTDGEKYDDTVMTTTNLAGIWTWIASRTAYIRFSGGGPGTNRLDNAKTNISFTAGAGSLSGKIFQMTGRAPIQVRWIKVNGVTVPDEAIAWTSVTNYDLQYVVTNNGSTALQVAAWDEAGRQVGSNLNVTVNYAGPMSSPLGNLVISEIMYDSGVVEGGFIEIHNRNVSEGFDLSGFRLNGLDFIFPAGSYLAPSNYGVVVASTAAFHNTYTNNPSAVMGEYTGQLDNGGETISLEQPPVDGIATNWILLDTVRYDSDRPWPTEAKGTRYSLQAIDVNEDNNRCGNWAISRKWQKFTATGMASNGYLYLNAGSSNGVYIDDIRCVAGTNTDVGVNIMSNGDFEAGFPGPWIVGEAYRFSEVVKGPSHSGTHSLFLKSVVPDAAGINGVVQDRSASVVTGQTYALSFWYLAPPEGADLNVRFSGSWIASGTLTQPVLDGATPGRENNVTADIAAIPTLWINEIMPNNTSVSFQDNNNESDPWLELYNTSTSSYDLVNGNFYLTDNYDNMTRWKFSTAQSIGASQRLVVWLDGQTNQNASGYPHAGFRLGSGTGTVALVQVNNSRTTVVDFVNYTFIPTNKSYGCWPDGDVLGRQLFDVPTPGTVNNSTSTVITLKINEWLASGDKNGGFPDPADGDFDDWFEIYNPNGAPVDVTGYSVTDDPLVTDKYVLPSGWIIPANGFMQIWADNETGQNGPGFDVHANFKLGADGGVIHLYAPDQRLVNAISYGLQLKNVSEGRYTDGATEIYRMGIPTPKAANRMFEVTRATMNTNGTLMMRWNTLPGREYQVIYTALMGSTNWTQMYPTNLAAGTNTTLNATLPISDNRRFYRLIQK